MSLGVYSVDANLNFPIARPQVLVVWAATMSLIMAYYQKYISNKNRVVPNHKLNTFLALGLLVIKLPCFYITNLVYKSLKGQMMFGQDFNSNKYNFLNQVDNIVPGIPK